MIKDFGDEEKFINVVFLLMELKSKDTNKLKDLVNKILMDSDVNTLLDIYREISDNEDYFSKMKEHLVGKIMEEIK